MTQQFQQNRRRFLQQAGVGIIGTSAIALTPASLIAEATSTEKATSARKDKPKRIIYLVSDGMSQSVPSLTENFSKQVRGQGTTFAELLRNPAVSHGYFETYSLDSLVTDSAAAGSAWGSGSRVFNGALNTLPDGTELTPIFHLAKSQGWGTGLVTTATVTHATPASFTVSHASRGGEDAIAEKYLDVADMIMGGGTNHFSADRRGDKQDLAGKFAAEGYTVLTHRNDLLALTGKEGRILATFDGGALPYTIDQIHNAEWSQSIPTLAEMSAKAIAALEQNHPDGWILQIEGARIDHAAHTNDAAGLLWDQLAFDDAVAVALEFAAKNPDTLIVVTTDHGNANPGLSSYGSRTNEMFARIAHAKGTTHAVRGALRSHEDSPADIHDIIKETLGLDLSKDHIDMASRMLKNDFSMVVHDQHRNFNGAFNALLSNYNGIGWVSTQHTEDYVPIAALGPMQERFGHLIKNTDAFRILADAIGSDHVNPSMDPEAAKQHANASPNHHYHQSEDALA